MSRQTVNLGILAHVDAGKTSLTERLLFENGETFNLGSVDAGTTQTDTGEIERERKITIRSAVASFTTDNLQVNLVDTPGHPDFIAEVERALSVLDGVVLVVSAVEGVQAQTRVLMKSLARMRLPTLIFVNKVDRVGARSDELLEEIRLKLAPYIVPMNSVVDAGTANVRVIRQSLADQNHAAQVAEILAENEDDLLRLLVEEHEPSCDELQRLMLEQTASGLVHPLFFGSALTGQGAADLTFGIRNLLARGTKPLETEGLRGTVFAIERITGGEKVAYIRLFSGELRERDRVTFRRVEPNAKVNEFTGRIVSLDTIGGGPCFPRSEQQDQSQSRIEQAQFKGVLTAGNIAKLRGLSDIRVGDYVGEEGLLTPRPNFSPPSLASIVRVRHPGQEFHLHRALTSLADEDPLIQTRAIGHGAISVLLYGAVQKEVIEERLWREFGLEAVFDDLRPVYFERPAGVGEAMTKFDPRAQSQKFWATIGLRLEPTEFGSGVSFRREAKWGTVPRAFHRATEDTVLESLQQGLYGWPVTDCAVTLTRIGYNAPTSVAADFRNLTPLVLMRALQLAGTRVYEPCSFLEVEAPTDTIGSVIGYLTALGADITQSNNPGTSSLVKAMLPARLIHEVTAALPGLSHGEGLIWSEPGTDREVRGVISPQERLDGNPLNYEEYMRFLAQRDLGIAATTGNSRE